MNERLVDRLEAEGDDSDVSLRPLALEEFIGQERARANLRK